MSDLRSELGAGLSGRYLVDREIGRGGMASVFLARDLRHDRPVAMKVLHPEVGAAIGPERFQREIHLAAQLTHPGILPLLDSGVVASEGQARRFWYTMPFIEGESLRDRLGRARQLPVEAAVRIAREVAEALDYAHRHGVVHRDVKPENILLQDGRPLLADFGIARAVGPEAGNRLTESGITLGTPAYMSPEQAAGDSAIDGRSDIFALGVVLYEMLVGEPPFTGPTAAAILARMVSEPPRAIRSVRPQATPIEPVVLKALAQTPADRFDTAAQFAAALANPSTATITTPSRRSPTVRWRVIGGAAAVLGLAALALWAARARDPSTSTTAARIAVLPFRAAGDSARTYFAAGMTGALRSKLASVPGIEVVASTCIEAATDPNDPAAVARELGATYALTGTVAWDSAGGGRIRVQPQLVSASNGRVALAWPSPVEAPTRDVFDVEREITERIAAALDVTLGAAVRARLGERFGANPAAYELLLRAEEAPSRSAQREAWQRAVALDSMLGPAWASLAIDAAFHYVNFEDPRDVDDARVYSARALATAPRLAESHLARGIYHRSITLQRDSAITHLIAARELAPGSAEVAHVLASGFQMAGRPDEALLEARRGAGLDPMNPAALGRVARALLWLKRPAEAWDSHESVRALGRRVGSAQWSDGPLIRLAQGNLAAARASIASIADPAARVAVAAFLYVQAALPQAIDDSLAARVCDQGTLIWFGDAPWGRRLVCADVARRAGRPELQRAQADSAVVLLQEAVSRNPGPPRQWQRLAWALLLAGDTVKAMAAADSSLRRRRIDVDDYFGAHNTFDYASVTALAGDANRAVPALEELLDKPSHLTSAWLRIDPTFDRIRADPRFGALAARPDRR